jgi:hypothetical protein
VTTYALVVVVGVDEKVIKAPPLFDRKVGLSDPTATVKSEAIPKVAPEAPETAMVQTTGIPTRTGFTLVQDKLDEVVGKPREMKVWGAFVITLLPVKAVTKNEVVAVTGIVENVYVAPKLFDESVDTVDRDEGAKSLIAAVVAPPAPETVIVQMITLPIRSGLLGIQARVDADVGAP